MVGICIVCGSKEGKPTASFHKFPSDIQRRSAWLQACNLQESQLKARSYICSFHFKADDFDDRLWPKTHLKKTAVPAPSTRYTSCRPIHQIDNHKDKIEQSSIQGIDNGLSESTISIVKLEEPTPMESINEEEDESMITTVKIEVGEASIQSTNYESDSSNITSVQLEDESSNNINNEAAIVKTEEGSSNQIINDLAGPSSTSHDAVLETHDTFHESEPRFVGDLRVHHFTTTPQKAKRYLDLVMRTVVDQRKKIKLLRTQNTRLQRQVESLKEMMLTDDL